jgi:hypothetical protein
VWTFNGTIPGPTIRVTEGDLVRIHFINNGSKAHSMHFHGIHKAGMDEVFEIINPGGRFIAGAPAIIGAWIGGFVSSSTASLVFLAIGAGAIFQIVVAIERVIIHSGSGRLMAGPNVTGLATGC